MLPSEPLNLEMEQEFLEALDMMFLMEDSTILEDIEPLQNLNGTSSPPPLLISVSSFDRGELVGSARILNDPCSKSMSQTLECEDGNYGIPNPTSFKTNIPNKEDIISLQGKSSDVSHLIIRDYENATKGNDSYNSYHSHKELHSMHERMQKAASHTRGDQPQRRIWGISSCNGNQKIGTGNWGACEKKCSNMDVELHRDEVSKKNRRVFTRMSEAGSKRGASTRISSQSDHDDQCTLLEQYVHPDNGDAMELECDRGKRKDMSRNLVSERRRRDKLKEKLYSLRALVPNISKMDTASIVADAIRYVRELKRQVEEVEMEVAELEALANGVRPLSKFVCTQYDRPAHHIPVVKGFPFSNYNMRKPTRDTCASGSKPMHFFGSIPNFYARPSGD